MREEEIKVTFYPFVAIQEGGIIITKALYQKPADPLVSPAALKKTMFIIIMQKYIHVCRTAYIYTDVF